MESQGTLNNQNTPEREEMKKDASDFLIIKMVWQWHKGTYTDLWKREQTAQK